MRHIPPEIWTMAVAVGKLQRAIDETRNAKIVPIMFAMRQQLNQFLNITRKDVRK